MIETKPALTDLPVFDRNFWDGKFRFTRIGSGALGGKASGLVFIKDLLTAAIDPGIHSGVEVNVPTMAVLATECFDAFVKRNRLAELSFDEMSPYASRSGLLLPYDLQACWKMRWIVLSPGCMRPR